MKNTAFQHLKARGIGAGSIARWILEISNMPLGLQYLGKPSTHITNYIKKHIFKKNNTIPNNCVMVGDTIDTDIIFGNKSGLKTLLVLSGSTTRHHLTLNNKIFKVIDTLLKSNIIIDIDINNIDINNIIGKDLLNAYKSKQSLTQKAILKHNILSILYSNLISDDTYTKPTYIFDSLKALNSNI